jgi:hypothetical protein
MYLLTVLLHVFVVFGCAMSPNSNVSLAEKNQTTINRFDLVSRHNPHLMAMDPKSPFTLGNGKFAFTADITGLQTFPDLYFAKGIPLETKARWAWHSRSNPAGYELHHANEIYSAYGRNVEFPTQMNSPAGQWLRQNPHDLPLARLGFVLNHQVISPQKIEGVQQFLDLWRGTLHSQFQLQSQKVKVRTFVDSADDSLFVNVQSPLLYQQILAVRGEFPRGYDLSVKNTPNIIWQDSDQHMTTVLAQGKNYALLQRQVDDFRYFVVIRWQGNAHWALTGPHQFELKAQNSATELSFSMEYLRNKPNKINNINFINRLTNTQDWWQSFWRSGAAVDFLGSTNPQAQELERRIVLSRYLMAVQSRSEIPAQETGLTSSSWYGKFHTEMAFWHCAHWILWGNSEFVRPILDWYLGQLPSAKKLAESRGLAGARWAKMVGPDNRESPGGNPLIIWNQPQPIHLAELYYKHNKNVGVLNRYASLVEETANAMASMLVWNSTQNRYELTAPIWIAQEIYDPKITQNPTFELAYWCYGLKVAQEWRIRLGKKENNDWAHKLQYLSSLPIKNGRYVAMESIPDTFDNPTSRLDHPSFLAAYGMLRDKTVDENVMMATLNGVRDQWNWQHKNWGWDFPMLAMTAARLQQQNIALNLLLAKNSHNEYAINGHVAQPDAQLPVYLPANGALLSAVAMLLGGWEGAPNRQYPGFPIDAGWKIKAEGFVNYDH